MPIPPDGHLQLTSQVPDTPSLAGLEVPLQAAVITDFVLPGGGFTNVLPVPIQ